MIDFLMIATRTGKRGVIEIYPKFIIKKSKDLMIRGSDFYAVWLEKRGLWSTDEQDHLRAACWNLLWALNQRVTHPELDDRFAVKVGEVKKKNYQVLCPNCEATIIKENGQICDGVAWRVCVPNEKIKLKCRYCNRAVIVSIKDIVDERTEGKI